MEAKKQVSTIQTPDTRRGRPTWRGSLLQFLGLFALWFLLSGKLEFLYLGLGVLASACGLFLTANLLAPTRGGVTAGGGAEGFFRRLARAISYAGWLLYSIVKANLQVVYLVLHPKIPIRPRLLTFKVRMQSQWGRALLANSITLTPGTITVDLQDGGYLVHALVPEAAASLTEAHMQSKIQAIFGEKVEPLIYIHWVEHGES